MPETLHLVVIQSECDGCGGGELPLVVGARPADAAHIASKHDGRLVALNVDRLHADVIAWARRTLM